MPVMHLHIEAPPYIEGILPKGPYLPCVSMAGRALLAGYHRYVGIYLVSLLHLNPFHWEQNNIADILQVTVLNTFSKISILFIQISLKLDLKEPNSVILLCPSKNYFAWFAEYRYSAFTYNILSNISSSSAAISTAWWSHQMETFSVFLALCSGDSPDSGEFPAERPVTWSYDVFFDLRPN